MEVKREQNAVLKLLVWIPVILGLGMMILAVTPIAYLGFMYFVYGFNGSMGALGIWCAFWFLVGSVIFVSGLIAKFVIRRNLK
jgi:hypothetical protein